MKIVFGIVMVWMLGGAIIPHAAGQSVLLNDVTFSTLGAVSAEWSTTQHAGEPSYRFTAEDGVLSIEKTGKEPWGLVLQPLNAERLQGRKVRFSAEMSGSFTPMSMPPFESSGLSIRVRGWGEHRFLGKAILRDETAEIEQVIGDMNWQLVSLVVEIPQQASDVEISMRLTYDGILRVRNPQVEILDSE